MYKGLFISLLSTLQTFVAKKSVSSCFEYYGCCRLGAPRQGLYTEHSALENMSLEIVLVSRERQKSTRN